MAEDIFDIFSDKTKFLNVLCLCIYKLYNIAVACGENCIFRELYKYLLELPINGKLLS